MRNSSAVGWPQNSASDHNVDMFHLLQFSSAIAIAYVYAVAAIPLLRMPARFGRIIAVGVASLVMLCPLLIAPEKMIWRAIATLVCGDLWFKMIDYARQYGRRGGDGSAGFVAYLRFLCPFPVLLVVFGQRDKRLSAPPPRLREFAIVCLMGCLIAAGFVLLRFTGQFQAVRTCFPLDHAVMLLIFVPMLAALSRSMWGLERLAQFDIRPIIDGAFLATTPGEFWRRYNTRVADWMHRNVFRPSGGRRAPIRGVFLTFLVSAHFPRSRFRNRDLAHRRISVRVFHVASADRRSFGMAMAAQSPNRAGNEDRRALLDDPLVLRHVRVILRRRQSDFPVLLRQPALAAVATC